MFRRSLCVATAAALFVVISLASSNTFAAKRPGTSREAQTERYFESIRENPNLLVAFLLEMPKGGDLHNHLSGAIYAESMIDWAATQKYGEGNDEALIGACVDPKTMYLSAPPCGVKPLGFWPALTSHPLLLLGLLLFLIGLALFTMTEWWTPEWWTRNPNISNRAERNFHWLRATGFALIAVALFLTYYGIQALRADQSATQTVPVKQALADPELYRRIVDAFSMRNWQLSGQSGHDHFFDTFDKFGTATHGNTGKMLAETANRAASQHEVYQELMFTPTGKPFGDMLNSDAVKAIKLTDDSTPETFAAMRKALLENGFPAALQYAVNQATQGEKIRNSEMHCGLAGATPGCNVTQRYLFQVLRGLPKEIVFAQMLLGFELAEKYPESGFVGLNLVMAEDYYIPMHDFRLHMRMLQYLHGEYPKVHISLHAGELVEGLVPPEGLRFHVRESIEVAGAERIGHGVDTLNETNGLQLLHEMAQKNVMVEICLTSNDVILGVHGKDHPLHDFMRAGVPVALATDDEGVARSDMTHEYLRGVEDQHLTYSDLKRMARTSLEHAFIQKDSLWSDAKTFTPVKQCATVPLGAPQTAGPCYEFLKDRKKATLQWELERQFGEFEARDWTAITTGSSRATAH